MEVMAVSDHSQVIGGEIRACSDARFSREIRETRIRTGSKYQENGIAGILGHSAEVLRITAE